MLKYIGFDADLSWMYWGEQVWDFKAKLNCYWGFIFAIKFDVMVMRSVRNRIMIASLTLLIST